jgi:hypothetical protein
MDFKNTLDIVGNELLEAYKSLEKAKSEGGFHKIDMDLLLSRVRHLYELLVYIDKENLDKSSVTLPGKEKKEMPKEEQGQDIEQKEKIEEKATKAQEQDKKREEKAEMEKKEAKETAAEEPLLKETEIKQKEEGPSEKKEKSPGIVAERFYHKQFRNELMAKNKSQEDLSTRVQAKPVKDIKKAIGINEKFLFIRELFDNNTALYNDTIEKLNQMAGMEEARQYLNENFSWEEDELSGKFLAQVHRKFIQE